MLFPALVLLAAAASPADEQLAEAQQAVEEFRYERAAKVAEAALLLPDISRETLISLYELLGVSLATRDRPARAREAFVKLLLIAPDHQLSKSQPPRIRTPFFEARTQAARLGALAITAPPVTRVDGRVTQLAVRVTDNPVLPARAVRFTLVEDGGRPRVERVSLSGSKDAEVKVSARALNWTAELLGERDAVLEVAHGTEVPPREPVAVVESPPPLPPLTPPPSVAPPPTWVRPLGAAVGIAGLAALGAGTVLAVLSTNLRWKLDHLPVDGSGVVVGMTQTQAAALDHTARTEALVADILFVTGGVLAGTGAGLFFFGPKDSAPAAPAVTLLVGPGTLGLWARF